MKNPNEPLVFTEQGVVYLFSKYWEQIPRFTKIINRITCAHTHYPDFRFIGRDNNNWGLEFEYKLSGFSEHLSDRCFGKLKEEEIKKMLIVYWIEDSSTETIKKRLSKHKIRGEFICLKDEFNPILVKSDKSLLGFWSRNKHGSCQLNYKKNKKVLSKLVKDKQVNIMLPNRDIWRTIGWNETVSGKLSYDHWKKLFLLTVPNKKGFRKETIPKRLYLKPKGTDKIIGYFEIDFAFSSKHKSKKLEVWFRDNYYFSFKEIEGSICFIYKKFHNLSKRDGETIYSLLKIKGLFNNSTTSRIIPQNLMKKIGLYG